MNPGTQGNSTDGSGNVPIKRKRGRPRKYPIVDHGENIRPHSDQGGMENVHVRRGLNANYWENAPVPPGFERVNGNWPFQVDSSQNGSDGMEGQVVSGVIETEFDAGYLLSVRIGNSETTFRGVVFKPGHYVPVAAENDVAPDIQMIQRNEVPFPRENTAQMQGDNLPTRGKNEQLVSPQRNGTAHPPKESSSATQVPRLTPYAANPGTLKTNQAHFMPSKAPNTAIPRGNVVPVVLQPAYLSNGVPTSNQCSAVASQAVHPPKSEQVAAAYTSNGSTPTDQPTVESSELPSQLQTDHEKGIFNPAEVMNEEDTKSMRLPGMPVDQLVSEVIKRVQHPSQSMDTQVDNRKSACKFSMRKESVGTLEGEVGYMEHSFIQSLRAVEADCCNQSTAALDSKPLESNRTGKMTELLQALQENMTRNQAAQVQEPAIGSRLGSNQSPETEVEGKETVRQAM